MPSKYTKPSTRRSLLLGVGAGTIGTLAGCIDALDDDTDDSVDEDDPDEDGPLEPIQQLVDIFDDQPVNDDQLEIEGERRSYTPRHVWKWVGPESFIGLHFDELNPEEATEIDYVLIGRKGLFTEESQRDESFSHFHEHTADSWEEGHGGEEGDEGYWLTHIAAREIQYPFHEEPISPRVDYEFNPTPPPAGSTGHSTDFDAPDGNEGSLSATDRDALLEVFDARPFNDDQFEIEGSDRSYTPRHVWFEATDDVYLFLHFNELNPEEATELDYFGISVNGQFTVEDIPAGQTEDFTHFHSTTAEGWEAGHGGQDVDDEGYWILHHSVREIQYPFHEEPIEARVDRDFMPTPPPDAE